MKKAKWFYGAALSALLMSGVAVAAHAPDNMVIDNNTMFWSNAYVHDMASSQNLGPKSGESIPWNFVTALCHGATPPLMKGSDSCAFDVYATLNPANPKQIHVATVTMYLSDGNVVNIDQLGLQYGLKVVSVYPGYFELNKV